MSIQKWNMSVLKRQGVTSTGRAPTIVRSVGDAVIATLWDGTKVEREEFIFVGSYGLVKCIPYELHFIYEIKDFSTAGWGLWCTCGSIAAVIGVKDYSKLMSPAATGWVLACVRHTTIKQNDGIGQHADGSHE